MSNTETYLAEVSQSIVKNELYDVSVMEALLRDTKHFSPKDLRLLSLYKKHRIHGSRTQVIYEYGKGCEKNQLGRLYVKHSLGLQSFPFDMRNPLLEKHYFDVDMENAHYNLLYTLSTKWELPNEAIRQYIEQREDELNKVSSNRSIAKTAFLKVAYGGNIKLYNENYNDEGLAADTDITLLSRIEKEMKVIVDVCWGKYTDYHKIVKTKPNPKFSLFALILQTEERKCLLAMDAYLASKGRYVGVYIHDGAEVEKLPNEVSFPEELLRGAEAYIQSQLSYTLRLVVKSFKHSFVAPDIPRYVEVDSSVIVDDTFAARMFATHMGKNIVLDGGRVWVFEDGLWSPEQPQLKRVITNCADTLIFHQGTTIFNYSGCVKKTGCLIDKLHDILPRQDGYFKEKIHTDIGKLLFPNGIYDFKTSTFTEDFDPRIVFTARMPRPFSTKSQFHVDEIRRISFTEAFENDEHRNSMLHSLLRAFIGDVLWKKFVIGTGWGNSGKGMLATLLHTSMGMLCSDFNGNNLLYKTNQGESARDYGWMMPNVKSRIAIGSEVMMKNEDKPPCIDGVLIKTISSGVDEIKMRALYQNDSSYVNKAIFFMFAQDIPAIMPAEKTVLDRLITTEWSWSYVANPVLPYEKKADMELAHKFSTAEYGDAFFWLMVEEYEAWKESNFAEPEITDFILEERENFVDVVNYRAILEVHYTLGDASEFVSFKDIYPHFQCSKTMLGRNLKGAGLTRANKKINGKKEVVYYGIAQRQLEL